MRTEALRLEYIARLQVLLQENWAAYRWLMSLPEVNPLNSEAFAAELRAEQDALVATQGQSDPSRLSNEGAGND